MIFRLLIYVGLMYYLILFVWVYYLMLMKFKAARDRGFEPHKLVVFHAYLLIALGTPFYILLNFVVASIIFLDPPREWQFTKRCQRYIRKGSGWRYELAKWTCENWLDPFEEEGHC